MQHTIKNLAIRGLQGAVLVAGTTGLAMAADDDYSSIGAAVGVAGVVTAIIAMGAIKIGPNVAKWAANKLASFF